MAYEVLVVWKAGLKSDPALEWAGKWKVTKILLSGTVASFSDKSKVSGEMQKSSVKCSDIKHVQLYLMIPQ